LPGTKLGVDYRRWCMSFDVDYSEVGPFFLAARQQGPFNATWPGEFMIGQWFAAALSLDPDNGPGTSLQLAQGIAIQGDGQQVLETWVVNNSDQNATFHVNYLSTPSKQ
jgi:hypothetical protein